MINKLRFKFIRITMISIFSIIVLIIASINIVNFYRSNRSMDTLTSILLSNGGTFRRSQNIRNSDAATQQWKKINENKLHNSSELPFSTRFFSVTLNDDNEIINYSIDHIASVKAEQLQGIAQDIMNKDRDVGWYHNFRFRRGIYQGNTMLIMVESTSVRNSVLSVLSITLAVGAVAFIAIFSLVAVFSRHAIKPIAQTYEKQKQFITDASHELKTPLTVISANSEILSMTFGENEWCDGIERQTRNMLSLIHKMIQISKLDEGNSQLQQERFNIGDAVYDTASIYSAPSETRGVQLTVNVQPELYIVGDEASFRQMISILTDNAVKYCDEKGSINVSVCMIRKGTDKGKICVALKNTYRNSDSLDTEKIFDRFYRGDESHAANHSYGLGLPIAQSIAQTHHSSIKAQKQNGEIIFSFLLQSAAK